MVTFVNSASHPLDGMTMASSNSTTPNPIHDMAAGNTTMATVTFGAEGAYGYFCTNHGSDGPPGTTGMSGAVYVTP